MQGPAILVANHLGALGPIAVGAAQTARADCRQYTGQTTHAKAESTRTNFIHIHQETQPSADFEDDD